MTSIDFCKFHGFGNDYIVIERTKIPQTADLSELVKAICNRHTGVGGDGIAVLEKLDGVTADYFCEIVNPDGSIAGFSGNGTRCAVAYLHYQKIWSEPKLRLETRSGIKTYQLIERKGDGEFWFEAEIGKPIFASDLIPVGSGTWREAIVNEKIYVDGQIHSFSAVNVGNPVACIFVETFAFDWRTVGRAMEVHQVFPQRSNIVFVKVIDLENIEIRIWERAAGETSSSGTCSSGAAVLSAFLLKTERVVNVKAEGGTTRVVWRDDDEIVINGRADLAFSGIWPA
ncbi:MAG TPA: diaminopimelate epimerase [Pyrinomonadaceae bacterium]|nr:diaminopimelate epimerase [Acidobacteriota bacterium]HQZ95033.1 diaminopimelate epimerase [Pyrinomonadaceae bacterium]